MKKILFFAIVLIGQTNLCGSFLKDSALIFVKATADKVVIGAGLFAAYKFGLFSKAFKYCTKTVIKEVISEETDSYKAEVNDLIKNAQQAHNRILNDHIQRTCKRFKDHEKRIATLEDVYKTLEQRVTTLEGQSPNSNQLDIATPSKSSSSFHLKYETKFNPQTAFTLLKFKIPNNQFNLMSNNNSFNKQKRWNLFS